MADSSDLPNKNPQVTVSSDSEIDISTPPPNAVLKKRGKNLATISERFAGSPVRDYNDVEYVTFELIGIKDKANDDNAEEIMYPPANSSQRSCKEKL